MKFPFLRVTCKVHYHLFLQSLRLPPIALQLFTIRIISRLSATSNLPSHVFLMLLSPVNCLLCTLFIFIFVFVKSLAQILMPVESLLRLAVKLKHFILFVFLFVVILMLYKCHIKCIINNNKLCIWVLIWLWFPRRYDYSINFVFPRLVTFIEYFYVPDKMLSKRCMLICNP